MPVSHSITNVANWSIVVDFTNKQNDSRDIYTGI